MLLSANWCFVGILITTNTDLFITVDCIFYASINYIHDVTLDYIQTVSIEIFILNKYTYTPTKSIIIWFLFLKRILTMWPYSI